MFGRKKIRCCMQILSKFNHHAGWFQLKQFFSLYNIGIFIDRFTWTCILYCEYVRFKMLNLIHFSAVRKKFPKVLTLVSTVVGWSAIKMRISLTLNELILYFDFNLLETVYKNFDMKRWKKKISISFVLLTRSMRKHIFSSIKI